MKFEFISFIFVNTHEKRFGNSLTLLISLLDDDDAANEEAYYSRGRSRSRSVHEYDSNIAHMLVNNNNDCAQESTNKVPQLPPGQNSCTELPPAQLCRTGPLHQKEVLALKKVLPPR